MAVSTATSRSGSAGSWSTSRTGSAFRRGPLLSAGTGPAARAARSECVCGIPAGRGLSGGGEASRHGAGGRAGSSRLVAGQRSGAERSGQVGGADADLIASGTRSLRKAWKSLRICATETHVPSSRPRHTRRSPRAASTGGAGLGTSQCCPRRCWQRCTLPQMSAAKTSPSPAERAAVADRAVPRLA